jgi:hypothetical protein
MFLVKNQYRASGFPPDAHHVFGQMQAAMLTPLILAWMFPGRQQGVHGQPSTCAYNSSVNWIVYRRAFGLALLLVSLAALAWSLWPMPEQARSLVVSTAEMFPSELSPGKAGELPALAQPRLLLLEWPSVMRAGEVSNVRLVFDVTGQKMGSSQASPGMEDPYVVLAEARLELPGVPHTPLGEVSQALLPGRPVMFSWFLRPVDAGEAQGTIWLHLRFIPVAGGTEVRQVLTAQRIELRVIDWLGISGPWVRALASAGLVVGAAVCLDGAALWLWRRLDGKGVS